MQVVNEESLQETSDALSSDGPLAATRPGIGLVSPLIRGGRAQTADELFERISKAIISLELPPGLPISENELARRFDVSRTPVREAIIALRACGLIETVPQVGTFVTKIDEASVGEARFIREALELASVRHAVAGASSEEIAALGSYLEAQTESAESNDYDGFWALDERMHEAITRLSGHRTVWQAILQHKVHLDRVRRLSLPTPNLLPYLVEQHAAIVGALEQRDGPAAERAVSEHLAQVVEHLPRLREQFPDYFVHGAPSR